MQTPAGGAASGGAAQDGPAPDTATEGTAAQTSEAQASGAQASETQASEAQASEAQASEAQASEAQASETQASEAQASEAQAGEAQAGERLGRGASRPGTPGPRAAGGTGAGGSRRTKVALLAAAGVGVLVIAGVTIGALGAARPPGHTTNVSDRHSSGAQAGTAAPLQVESVTQGGAVTGTNGASPVRVTLSAPLASNSPMPAVHPATPGTWTKAGTTLTFTPSTPFWPGTRVRVTLAGGSQGLRSAAGGVLAKTTTERFTTKRWSSLRLKQMLAQMGYLPLKWKPQNPTAFQPDNVADRAGRRVLAAGRDLHLEEGLPVHPDQLLGRPVQPDHAGGDPGLPVQPRPHHDRRHDARPLAGCGPGRRGGQGQPQRLHLRAGQQGEPGDADRVAQRACRPAHAGQHRHPGRAHRGRHRSRSTCATRSRS